MKTYNLNNKKFALISNSENGTVDSNTIFHYRQNGEIITATYSGGTIKKGNIIAIIKGPDLDMLYHCITEQNQLKAGKAFAKISLNENGKLELILDWQWMNQETDSAGKSKYIEI